MIETKDILFIGLGKTPQAWYRCFLPALHMHADWVGVIGEPPKPIVVTGLVKDQTSIPVYDDYKVIVIQQPMGRKWLGQIRRLQERGVKIVFEIDDYLHGVRKQEGHDFAHAFDKRTLKDIELCMRACDAMTCSTEYLANRYRSFNRNVHLIENGLDMSRYRLTRPERPWVLPGGVVEIPLHGGVTRGPDGRMVGASGGVGSAFVDAQDADAVMAAGPWTLHDRGYAHAKVDGQTTYLHRFIVRPEPGLVVDHRNTDKLDCRRANLEAVTDAENRRRQALQPKAGRGVRMNQNGHWTAYLDTPDGRIWLGHAHESEEAASAIVEHEREQRLGVIDAPDPIRRAVMIGWAGATGHSKPLTQWVPAIAKVMARHPEVCFVSVGQASYAVPFQQKFGERRAIGIPFTCIENYPAAMTMFDIAIAPAGQTSWYKAKSDLRWLEAGALGVPIIAQKGVTYDKIVHGEDGFIADTPQEVEEYLELLVLDEKLRRRVGDAAKDYVAREREMSVMVPKWFECLGAIAGDHESMAKV